MTSHLHVPVLEKLLEPVSQSLNEEAARKLVKLRLDAKSQAQLDRLASKSNAGTLTESDRALYETYVAAIDLLGILQAKARTRLTRSAES